MGMNGELWVLASPMREIRDATSTTARVVVWEPIDDRFGVAYRVTVVGVSLDLR